MSQAQVLAELEEQVPNYLDSSPSLALMAADTVVFENYRDPQLCMAWLNAALRAWLRANERFNELAGRSLFYRYIVLPFPSLLGNWYKRSILVETILLHLHLQMWHGVVCCVMFADPRTTEVGDLVRVLNFLAMPAHGLLFDVPGFYRSDNIQSSRLEGTTAEQRLREIREFVTKPKRKLLWLYYDDQNFGGARLGGWRWESLREFFRYLYGPNLRCLGCFRDVGAFSLDHIAPVSKKYFQTLINFRPLCKACNSAKKDTEGEDPFTIRLLIPEELRTRELDDVFRQRPPWLGSLSRPQSMREVLARDLGLG